MADNKKIGENTTSTEKASTDEVTYSGDTSHVQLVRPVLVTGAEGSKTVVDLPGDNTNGLDVDVTRLPAITGAVIANAGTNLNTSLLALEAGGNLASAVTALQIIDDWDESDRAKVNTIVGQAGVTGGAGSVAANTPRVTLASDDPAVVALQLIDDVIHAEDTAHSSGHKGIPLWGVRNDANSTFGADLDYCPIAVGPGGQLLTFRQADLKRIAVTSAGLTTSVTAYSSGDQVGTQLEFANAARLSGGGGLITGITLISAADIIGAYDIVITDSTITLAADNAVYAISDADALKIVAIVPLAGAFDIGGNRVCQMYNLAIPYVCNGGTSLFASLITKVGHTFFAAVTNLQVSMYVERY